MNMVSTPTMCISFQCWECALLEYHVHFETLPSLLLLVPPQSVQPEWYRNKMRRNEPEMHWPHLDYEHIEYMMFRKGTNPLWLQWKKWEDREGQERIGMVDIFCLWNVLMDIMESLSVGRYSGTFYFQSHFPGKLGRPWSADKTGYGTVFCGQLYNNILQNVIEHPL